MDFSVLIQSLRDQFPGMIVEQQAAGVLIKREDLDSVCRFLKQGSAAFVSLHCMTAVDRKDFVEIVYHLHSFEQRSLFTLKVALPNEDLSIASLTSLWESANWLEREVFDLFGVHFVGHPDLRRILNPDEWSDHPLRKDFNRADFIKRPVN